MTAILYANTNWQREHGGQLRIWLPSSKTKQVKFPQEKLQSIAEHNQATPEAENRQPSQPRPEQLGCSQEQNSHAVTPQASDNIKHSGQHHHPDDAQHVQLQLADVSLEPRELKTAAFQNANRSSCAEDCTDSNSQRAVDPQAFTQLRRDCRPSCIQESQDPPSDRSSNGAETSDADEEGEAQGQSR